ncbi:MAG: GDSL-type esterase/lipase family protein [Bacteroidales bacterium]
MKRIFLLMMVALVAVGAVAQDQEYSAHYYKMYFKYDKMSIDSTNIVFFGNSLTEGGNWAEMLDNPKIENRGIIGDIVQGLIDRSHMIIEGQPAKLFILSGVNDISHNVTADSIARVMEKLIVKVQTESPNTKIYLQSLLPINNSFGRYKNVIGKEQVVRDANVELEKVAEKLNVTWIYLYDAMMDDEGNLKAEYTTDGLHLKPDAYKVWYDIVRPYVNE